MGYKRRGLSAVPCRLIQPHLRNFLDKWETGEPEDSVRKHNLYKHGKMSYAMTVKNSTKYSPMRIVAKHINVHEDNLRRILNLTKESVRFETADAIISYIDPLIWFTDPALEPYYTVS